MINFFVSRKALALLLLFFSCLLCSSCLHIEQVLFFQRDGSVVATYKYSLPISLLPAVQAAQEALEKKPDGQDNQVAAWNWFLNEKAVRDFFAHPGVEVRQYRQQDRDGRRHVQIIILARDASRAVNTGLFGAMKMQALEDGGTTLTVEPPGDNQPWSTKQKERWQQLAKDLQITFTVTAANAILSSNGQQVAPNSVTWRFSTDDNGLSIFEPVPPLTAKW